MQGDSTYNMWFLGVFEIGLIGVDLPAVFIVL
jgi:hypothetical protein